MISIRANIQANGQAIANAVSSPQSIVAPSRQSQNQSTPLITGVMHHPIIPDSRANNKTKDHMSILGADSPQINSALKVESKADGRL